MARPVVQLLILLLAIPAQYLISKWMNPSPNQTPVEVLRVVTALQNFCKKWVSPETWWEQIKKLWLRISTEHGECVAVEVMKYRSIAGHFGNSVEPRKNRPEKVKYRVGQVFQHKSLGYHGVITGWDEHAKAPDSWLDDHGGRDNTMQNLQPHYAVLPDKQDSSSTQDYVRQDDIEIVTNRRILNDLTVDYFEAFDGAIYLPRPFLRELYPED